MAERELNEFQKAFREKAMREQEESRQFDELDGLLEEDADTQHGRYMTFKCENDFYGIAICYVDEIIGIQQIAELPETEEYIRGLINLRGKIIPIIDVRLRFGKEAIPYDDRTCVIVITVGDDTVGLIVDTIAEVIHIPDSDILDPPTRGEEMQNRFVFGLGKVDDQVKLLVDPEQLIYNN